VLPSRKMKILSEITKKLENWQLPVGLSNCNNWIW
jgi:hypothetical protein